MPTATGVDGPDPLQAVIFDLDGTLTDTLPVAFSAFRAAIAQFSDHPFTDDELIGFFGPAEDGILQRLIPHDWEKCFELYLQEYATRHAECLAPFPGIQATLDLLHDRAVPLAIVTGKTPRAVEITLGHIDIGRYFDAVETGSAAGGTKPVAIRKLVEKWRVPPGRTAYVGDASSDMEAANAVGVLAVGAAWSATADEAVLKGSGAHVLFRTVDDFNAWIATRLA
jgi:phosphoglycolate phosphatase-like HAD superfamily hydrolase